MGRPLFPSGPGAFTTRAGESSVIGIVLAGHGGIAGGLRDAAEMILGPQQQLAVVPLRPAENLDEYRDRLAAAVAEVDAGDGALILADLFGGSPCNTAAYVLGPRTEVVAGVSLPMLLEVLAARQGAVLADLVRIALAAGQEAPVRLADRLGTGAPAAP